MVIKNTESLEKVLRRFKRKVEQTGILKELKKREWFVKPSLRRKLKNRNSYALNKKRIRRLEQKIII
jgi:small subunit ribosomal protein S21